MEIQLTWWPNPWWPWWRWFIFHSLRIPQQRNSATFGNSATQLSNSRNQFSVDAQYLSISFYGHFRNDWINLVDFIYWFKNRVFKRLDLVTVIFVMIRRWTLIWWRRKGLFTLCLFHYLNYLYYYSFSLEEKIHSTETIVCVIHCC